MCLTEFDEMKWRELMKEEGIEEGTVKTVLNFAKKGRITLEDAAEELGLDIEATEKLLKEHGISIPSIV